MNMFEIENFSDAIGALIFFGFMAFCIICFVAGAIDKLNSLDFTEKADDKPKLFVVDPTNIDQILARMEVSEKDRADMVRGTKLH